MRMVLEELAEEELYRYTRYRWIFDEAEKLAMRSRKFNISALIDAAIGAAGDSARSCTRLLKLVEGQNNKAFLMTMDNGAEVVAKVPNPIAGPSFYTTASEVATLHFLRTVLNLPVPRTFAWSTDPLNPVGTDYIITEKARGTPLGNLWYQWSTESQLDLVAQLVDFETKMKSISFGTHGCIYFKKDLEEKGLPVRDLDARVLPSDIKWLNTAATNEFAIGPLTEAILWEDERATMDLKRGPWTNSLAYVVNIATNEIQWAKTYAKPRINARRSIVTLETPEEYISLLQRYIRVVPGLALPPSRMSLWHPDLHLDNIFVDPETKEISCIIDWQTASVSEPFFQNKVPRMLVPASPQLTGKSSEKLDANEEEADKIRIALNRYEYLQQRNEPRWAALGLHNFSLLTDSIPLLCGLWRRNNVFALRQALADLEVTWNKVAPTVPFPANFTENELELYEKESENAEIFRDIVQLLDAQNLVPLGGMVRPQHYEVASNANNTFREAFINEAESETQRTFYALVWPYRDQRA